MIFIDLPRFVISRMGGIEWGEWELSSNEWGEFPPFPPFNGGNEKLWPGLKQDWVSEAGLAVFIQD